VLEVKETAQTAIWTIQRIEKKQIFRLILITLFSAILSLNNVAVAVITKKLVDQAQKGNLSGLIPYALIFAALFAFQALLNAFNSVQQAKLTISMSNSMREKAYQQLAHSDWQQYCAFHSDDVLTRLTSDIDIVVSTVVNTIPDFFALIINVLAAVLVLFSFSPLLAAFALSLGPVGVFLSRAWRRKLKDYHKGFQQAESSSRESLHEFLRNMLVVKTYSLEQTAQKKLCAINQERTLFAGKRAFVGACGNVALYLCYGAGYCFAFFWGAYQIAVSHGAFSFGTVSAILQLVGQVQGPFSALAREVSQLVQYKASVERLKEIDLKDRDTCSDTRRPPDCVGIRFRGVSFAYGGKTVLKGADCTIEPNEIIAVVGGSGEGKTTMLKLILALLQPQKGEVVLTGERNRPYGTVNAASRKLMAYVPQGNTLFTGTIRENLLYGDPDADDNVMIDLLKKVCAWPFVRELPDGLDSKIGERGLALSEGQAQRLCIARALIRKPRLLILDEATSALDIETEDRVLHAVRQMHCTCILVTHRLSPLKICSKIYRISEGSFEVLDSYGNSSIPVSEGDGYDERAEVFNRASQI
jgi:ABC-type multidrug transport system, ATPase and permease components